MNGGCTATNISRIITILIIGQACRKSFSNQGFFIGLYCHIRVLFLSLGVTFGSKLSFLFSSKTCYCLKLSNNKLFFIRISVSTEMVVACHRLEVSYLKNCQYCFMLVRGIIRQNFFWWWLASMVWTIFRN